MMDANAAPGSCDGQIVGQHGFDISKSTPFFRHFLEEFQLCLPCTFPCHQGPTTTWRALTGLTEHCIDFVCNPVDLLDQCSFSTTVPDFDLHNGDFDHVLVALQMGWEEYFSAPQTDYKRKEKISFHRNQINRECIEGAIATMQPPHWQVDIAAHFDDCNHALHRGLAQQCPKRHNGPKKSFITPEIWDFRRQKSAAKRQLHALGRRSKREWLSAVFEAWRRRKSSTTNDIDISACWFNYNT